MLFNRDLVEELQFGNLYDMVRNRTWTFDSFEGMLRTAAQLRSDVIPVVRAGFNVWGHGLVYANGGMFTIDTPTGFQFVGNTLEPTLNALQYIQDLLAQGFLVDGLDPFVNGGAVFSMTIYNDLRRLTTGATPNDIRVGLLPFPLGPDALAMGLEYGAVTHHVEVFYIINGIPRPDEAAAILVAMANRLSRPNVIGHELNFNLQDEESGEMLMMMLLNKQINPTELIGGMNPTFTNIVNLSMTPIQAMESIANSIQAQYDQQTGLN
jgi:hypothetical protein